MTKTTMTAAEMQAMIAKMESSQRVASRTLKKALDDAKTAENECKKLKAEIEQLKGHQEGSEDPEQNELIEQALQEHKTASEEKYKEFEQQIKDIKEELEKAEKEAEFKLSNLKKESDRSKEHAEIRFNEFTKLSEKEKQKSDAECKDLKTKIKELEAQLEAQRSQLAAAPNGGDDLGDELEAANKKIQALEQQVAAAKRSSGNTETTARQQLAVAKQELAASKKCHENTEKLLANTRRQLADLQQRHGAIKEVLGIPADGGSSAASAGGGGRSKKSKTDGGSNQRKRTAASTIDLHGAGGSSAASAGGKKAKTVTKKPPKPYIFYTEEGHRQQLEKEGVALSSTKREGVWVAIELHAELPNTGGEEVVRLYKGKVKAVREGNLVVHYTYQGVEYVTLFPRTTNVSLPHSARYENTQPDGFQYARIHTIAQAEQDFVDPDPANVKTPQRTWRKDSE